MSDRRTNVDEYEYDYKKSGSFGVFSSNGTLPIEYIMTSFTIDELPNLSLARELYSELNFDYLIQRDIDEERALSEISQYVASNSNQLQKDVVFLPPLLAAVVGTNNQDNIEHTFPDSNFDFKPDKFGGIYEREWPGLFKVTNYGAKTGNKFSVLNNEYVEEEISIDYGQAKIELNLTPKKLLGAKLVVIDGQHRLFALNYLREHEYNKVKNLVLPVCVVYSPHSIDSLCNGEENTPTIQSVMRSLFIDVNSTVERVSGHFLTLLQDNSLGSIICRDFCNQVLNEDKYGEIALGLIEWNTKKHKESLTITREHTITSIGVINSAFEESFSSKAGMKLISKIIDIDNNIDRFDFGFDEYDKPNPIPKNFPWRDFSLRHKDELTKLVNKNITNSLIRIFFETKQYKLAFNSFSESLESILEGLINSRDRKSNAASIVKNHLLYNDPIDKDQKTAKDLLESFYEDLKKRRKSVFPDIATKSLFQKAIFEIWYKLVDLSIANGESIDFATGLVISLLEKALENNAELFDFRQPFIQSTIYSGNKIKVSRESKKQISRLIISQLSNDKLLTDLVKNNSGLIVKLRSLSVVELSSFYAVMLKDKKKEFEKTYKVNYSIDEHDRERLLVAESDRDIALKSATNSLERDLAKKNFDSIISEIISEEIDLAQKGIEDILDLKDSILIYMADFSEEE